MIVWLKQQLFTLVRTVPYKNIFEDILFAEEFDVCSNDVRIRTQFTVT